MVEISSVSGFGVEVENVKKEVDNGTIKPLTTTLMTYNTNVDQKRSPVSYHDSGELK